MDCINRIGNRLYGAKSIPLTMNAKIGLLTAITIAVALFLDLLFLPLL